MQTPSIFNGDSSLSRIRERSLDVWSKLPDDQKSRAKKIWSVITFKWRWQIAMNIPYLVIFALDRTIPSVHNFNINLINSLVSQLPFLSFIKNLFN